MTNAPKVILITGCSSGFGMLAASRFASQGHYVIATMRNLNKQGMLADELKRRQAQTEIYQMDVLDRESIQYVIREIGAKHGSIDVLINNAGIIIGGAFEDLSDDEIRLVMETNFFGVQNVTRAVIPLMRQKRSGRIINISSISGFYGSPGLGAYNASKWALEGFSESLYYELKPFGINVILIEPGAYKTKIFGENANLARNFLNEESPYYKMSAFLKNRIDESLKDNYREPEEVVKVIERAMNDTFPKLRYTTEIEGKVLRFLKVFLPFRLFSFIYQRLLFKGFKSR
ncbi:MAG: SDR family oxidoreductase [Candidatus Omnitrophota bacterium]